MLQSMGSQRVRHDLATERQQQSLSCRGNTHTKCTRTRTHVQCDASCSTVGGKASRVLEGRLGRIGCQFSSVSQSCPTLCNPMNCSTPGLPVHHQLPKLTQTHVHQVVDAIQPSHPLSSPSPPTFHLSQHQGLSKWVRSSCQVAKVLEFQLQHQSFQ